MSPFGELLWGLHSGVNPAHEVVIEYMKQYKVTSELKPFSHAFSIPAFQRKLAVYVCVGLRVYGKHLSPWIHIHFHHYCAIS